MDAHERRLRTDDFDFELPPELIASAPLASRDGARLLVTGRRDGSLAHRAVVDLPRILAPGDLLVLNDTRVLPARVWARRSTGGRAELLFHAPVPGGDGAWTAFVRPAKKLRPGERLRAEVDPAIEIEAVEREPGAAQWTVRVHGGDAPLEELLERIGEVPLPPYIDRAPTEGDRERYQTVHARRPGAVAAPTAGLHFTPELFDALAAAGIERAFVTLHVGAGTFLPVTADHIDEHRMHAEVYDLPAETAAAVAACRARGGRVVAVGTTSARTLESCAAGDGLVEARAGSTDIFLHPDSPPRVVDGLLTNFHLPRSTLLMLVASLIGVEATRAAYRAAVEERYRFYSYGDAMLIL